MQVRRCRKGVEGFLLCGVGVTGSGIMVSTERCRQDVVARLKEKNTFLQVLVAGYDSTAHAL